MSIHPSAVIDTRAEIDSNASIGPFAIIDGPVRVEADCVVGASAILLGHTVIGRGCRIHSHAVIGDAPQDYKYTGAVSYCRIGDGSTVREGATVHRGTAPESTTVVGNRCLLMTNSHVGHNCRLGDDVTLVSGALLGGHVQVGDKAIISGNAAVHQFVRIGELALVGILARIVQDVPPFFITDRDGMIVGENRVGLSRAGLSPAERAEIKKAYQVIYRGRTGRNAAVNFLESFVTTPAGRRLLEFFATDSKCGAATKSIKFPRAA